MQTPSKQIHLGFTKEQFPPGVHICQVFTQDKEREDALLRFILAGLSSGEKSACFSDNTQESVIEAFLGEHQIDLNQKKKQDLFSTGTTAEVYFHDNKFSPERMLALIQSFYQDSLHQGCSGARIIGEMTSEVENIPGGSRLLEYESKVTQLLRTCPVSAVCQYDARAFDGGTIMEVLKVHPLMIVRGMVVRNPFFVTPEEYLNSGHIHA